MMIRTIPCAWALLGAWLLGRPAAAHTVSQGSMDVVVSSDRIVVRVRVPTEEVFVASALASSDADAPDSLDAAWNHHGRYLLRHYRLSVEGRPVAGRLIRVVPPEPKPGAAREPERVGYEFEFALQASDSPPGRLRLEQDVFKELEYPPGNRWEASYVVRVEQPGQPAVAGLLFTAQQPFEFTCGTNRVRTGSVAAARVDRPRMFREYLRHGLHHIVVGYDHLLFMGALVLATVTLWELVTVVTAFTLAHTVTLTLAVFGIARLPSGIVEPMIAASIVVVALQNVFWPNRTRGYGRLAIAFFFGLFHGLGFAGGLLDAMSDMSMQSVGVAIVGFSIGVELGHQVAVLPIFAALCLARATRGDVPARDRVSLHALRLGSAAISLAGVFYLVSALR
jgi:hydrogenase/urease accessory protein HupE